MEKLEYIDEHFEQIHASADVVWVALLKVLRSETRRGESLARILGCDPLKGTPEFAGRLGETVPGFRVVESQLGRKLSLRGRHRFSVYALTFYLDEGTLRARTCASFPGVLGPLYRTAVIGSRGHRLITQRLLRKVVGRTYPHG